jgi:hypothetical protein
MKLLASCLFVLALPFAIANAQGHHQPPQEALDACAQAKAGDACQVTFHEHTIDGTCGSVPDISALVCKPKHPHGPPPEALEACQGKAAGDACSVTFHEHTHTGSCAHGPDGNGPLACRPAD